MPLLIGMLFYTSCERDVFGGENVQETITVDNIEDLSLQEEKDVFTRLIDLSVQPRDWELTLKDKNSKIEFSKPLREESTISGPNGVPIKARMEIESRVLDENFSLFDIRLKGVQIAGNGKNIPFSVVEEVPVFPGCEDAADPRACFQEKMQRHISKNFRYPEEAQKQGIQGRVSVMFTIDEEGNITDIRQRGPHELLENETLRIIKNLPQMKPGRYRGKAVSVPFSIPITFKLQNDDSSQRETSGLKALKSHQSRIQVWEYSYDDAKNRVSGTVLHGSKPLPGVNIAVQGLGRHVVSDFDGKFTIEAAKGDAITFQYIGLPNAKLTVTE